VLTRIDRIQLVVPDREEAARRFVAYFAAKVVGEDGSRALNAHRTTVHMGESLVELLEPAGDGPIADFAARRTQGLWGVGFTSPDLDTIATTASRLGMELVEEDGALMKITDFKFGLPVVLRPDQSRERVGLVNFVYEVTNPVADWEQAGGAYTAFFGIDPARFCPIRSEQYGYDGTLTLFDPQNRLDRIEVVSTFGGGAMDRFYQRWGPSLYMCYIEVPDVMALASRLDAAGARYAHSEARAPEVGLFIHPGALCGMLMGVSLTNYAWAWSGHPDLAGPLAAGRSEH
jgi:hypothetical protein